MEKKLESCGLKTKEQYLVMEMYQMRMDNIFETNI